VSTGSVAEVEALQAPHGTWAVTAGRLENCMFACGPFPTRMADPIDARAFNPRWAMIAVGQGAVGRGDR
jgi:hypothetical protein